MPSSTRRAYSPGRCVRFVNCVSSRIRALLGCSRPRGALNVVGIVVGVNGIKQYPPRPPEIGKSTSDRRGRFDRALGRPRRHFKAHKGRRCRRRATGSGAGGRFSGGREAGVYYFAAKSKKSLHGPGPHAPCRRCFWPRPRSGPRKIRIQRPAARYVSEMGCMPFVVSFKVWFLVRRTLF